MLVATDIASRGLDTDIDHVVLFDYPQTKADYIHRAGRTGRAGGGGRVTAFVTSKEARESGELLKDIRSHKWNAPGGGRDKRLQLRKTSLEPAVAPKRADDNRTLTVAEAVRSEGPRRKRFKNKALHRSALKSFKMRFAMDNKRPGWKRPSPAARDSPQ